MVAFFLTESPFQCAFLLYLHMPVTKGAEVLYVRYVRPFVLKHQGAIDKELLKVINKVGDGRTERKMISLMCCSY